jgi:hypothetical protein
VRVERDPGRKTYMDQALAPVVKEDLEVFEMFSRSDSAKAAVRSAQAKETAKEQRRAARQASS